MGCVGPISQQRNRQLKYKLPKQEDLQVTIPRLQILSRACGYSFQIPQSNYYSQSRQINNYNLYNDQLNNNYQKCLQYYQEHNLDNAASYINKINQLFSKYPHLLANNLQYKQQMLTKIKNITMQYNDMIQYEQQIKRKGWKQKSNKKGIKISTRVEEEGTVGVKVQSVIDVPFQILIAVLIQMNLHKQFMPFMKISRQQKIISRNCRIGYAQNHFPIISVRQAFYQGIGYNRLYHDNSLFLYTRSIHDKQDLQKHLDYKCNVNKDYVQINYKYFVLKYQPLNELSGKVTLAMNVDIKLSILPIWLQDKLAQDFGQKFFANIIKISKNFKGSKWQQNVIQNPEVFQFFKNSLQKYFQTWHQKQQQNK